MTATTERPQGTVTVGDVPDLRCYDVILVNSSAGKDSQASLDVVAAAARRAGVLHRVVVVHADLGEAEWDVPGLPDGTYQAGFRANHLRLSGGAPGALALPARLRASEVTGAESYLHLDHSGDRWIALVDGVHQPEPGQALTVWLDPAHVYLFGSDGLLARPAPYAQAA